jgi:histidine ammonia-lyase
VIALDAFGLALHHVATICVQRCIKLFSQRFSGLPLQLTRHGPGHSGFATVQKTLTALSNRIRHAANRGSLDSLPVSEGVEDHAPMTANVVAKTAAIAGDLRYLAAIELLVAAQSVDLSGVDRATLGSGARAAYDAVRAGVTMLDGDRPLGPDIETIERALREGRFALEGGRR